MSGNFAIKGGGVGRLMANAILNFHFDFLNPSLGSKAFHLLISFILCIGHHLTPLGTTCHQLGDTLAQNSYNFKITW